MDRLHHAFAQGVRFNTEVQYWVGAGSGQRYCKLPVKAPKSQLNDGGRRMSLAQCVAVLCQIPFRQTYTALHSLEVGMDANDAREWQSTQTLQVAGRVCSLDTLQTQQATRVGAAALAAIRAGQLCRVQFISQAGRRWATVIGVEWAARSGQARALLLLDAGASEPWACGHNARLELRRAAKPEVHAGSGAVLALRYRALTGEACAVRLQGLSTVRLRTE